MDSYGFEGVESELTDEADSLRVALEDGFSWHYTSPQHDFWAVLHSVLAGSKVPSFSVGNAEDAASIHMLALDLKSYAATRIRKAHDLREDHTYWRMVYAVTSWMVRGLDKELGYNGTRTSSVCRS